MDPRGFNEISTLRASDADRDSAAAVINNALAEGRLTPDEHSERLDAIYAAKTHAELVPHLSDLPGQQQAAPVAGPPDDRYPARRGGRIIAILGGATRKGVWHPEPVINVMTVLGGAELDFRDAVLPGKEITLRAVSVLGGVEVTVPPEMRVVDNGIAILGGREIAGNPGEASSPEAPVLRIEGSCVLGGIEVKRKSRKPPKGLRRGRGLNISIEGGRFPVIRARPRDSEEAIRARPRDSEEAIRARPRDAEEAIRARPRDAEEAIRARPGDAEE